MSVKKVDFLIVGQGLAGTCLAWHLIEKGASVAFVDHNFKNASSKVATGLWHGLTFRKLGKTWAADDGIPHLYEHFTAVEKKLNTKLMSEQKVARIFRNEKQAEEWKEARSDSRLHPFVKEKKETIKLDKEMFSKPFGADEIQLSGRLNLSNYLEMSKAYFKEHFPYIEAEVSFTNKSIQVQGLEKIGYEKVVFCEGHKVKNNPIFNYLPIGQTKGEVLFLEKKTDLSHILNSGVFLLEDEKGDWQCGSNFEWDADSYEPTQKAREEITAKLKNYYKGEIEVKRQITGIRPTSPDRRPIIGEHPTEKNHYVFNGLGSKGVLIAPLVSKIFSDYLLSGSKIPDEMHVKRFEKFHPAVNM